MRVGIISVCAQPDDRIDIGIELRLGRARVRLLLLWRGDRLKVPATRLNCS
jgi:hypothetical protein